MSMLFAEQRETEPLLISLAREVRLSNAGVIAIRGASSPPI